MNEDCINVSRSYTIPRTWRRYLQGVIPVEEEPRGNLIRRKS